MNPERSPRPMTRLLACTALLFAAGSGAHAQVQSLTLGIQVNSPYGIGEPWATIRDGLQRLDFVESMSQRPDHKASTGEMRTRGGALPDLAGLAQALRDTGAGASLLGVEANIDGELTRHGESFILRLPGSNTVLRLAPVTKLLQRGQQPTDTEKAAYQALTAAWPGRPLRVNVVGPLVQHPPAKGSGQSGAIGLEVRRFLVKP